MYTRDLSTTVTGRIKLIKQPRGGHVNPKMFAKACLSDGKKLHEKESIHQSLTGIAVDYMTRYMISGNSSKAFMVSLAGAKIAGRSRDAAYYLKKIDRLDETAVINACRLATFDVWVRAGAPAALRSKTNDKNIFIDTDTIENIIIMVNRGVSFLNVYGPVIADSFTFNDWSYTDKVTAGDGDYLTYDTLWDFKTSKNKLNKDSTLQLLMYYLMGKRSGKAEFSGITKIGTFNPRLNEVMELSVAEIPESVVREVETEVIGYE